MERCKLCDIRGKTVEAFSWPLQAAAAEAQFPFPRKGWPKARVGTPAAAVRRCLQGILMFILLPRPTGTPSTIEGELEPHRHCGAVARNKIRTRVLIRLRCNFWK